MSGGAVIFGGFVEDVTNLMELGLHLCLVQRALDGGEHIDTIQNAVPHESAGVVVRIAAQTLLGGGAHHHLCHTAVSHGVVFQRLEVCGPL